ncbi:hypothetical protein M408DRAFT_101314 [Serendipita vermifera MAFF 305830]|uniref:Uncharacterized protein n=1 Tax=Serendipita vermifera MAFF 305830 TaxID=933852 RepID=A0A0C3BDE3_SERVB|nr:hypothetical protein M408DRAFT_101314 [Serendipita vermifera MAFF 305830]
MEDEPFLFPLVISRGHESIAEACNKAKSTTLAAWESVKDGNGPLSVAMGCKDGSIYLFQSQPTPSSPLNSNIAQEPTIAAKGQGPTSPRLLLTGISNKTRLHGPPSPAASNSSSTYFKPTSGTKHTSFQPARSRVQAGVTKEQAEAPKTYVNYEEEPAKLKSLLKTREPKDRGLIESLMPNLNIGHQRTSSSDTQSQKLEIHSSHSQVSTTQVSSTSTSPPASPTGNTTVRAPQIGLDIQSDGLKLAIHAFPPRFGQGRAITSLEYLEDGALLASLQECGTLSIYSAADGRCLSSIQIPALPATKPPGAIPPIEIAPKAVWKWCKMSSGKMGETTFLAVVAPEATTTWDTPPPRTRVTIVHVKSASERKFATPPEYMMKIGEWTVESPFQSVGLVMDASENSIFYHVTPSGHLLFSRINILDRVKLNQPVTPLSPTTGSTINLPMTTIPIPNPFKIRRPRAARPVSVYDIRPAEESLIELDIVAEYGELGFTEEEDFEVLVSRFAEGELLVTYSDKVLKVFSFKETSLKPIHTLELPDIQSVHFVSSYILIVRTDADVYGYRVSLAGDMALENILKIPAYSQDMAIATTRSSLLSNSFNSRGFRKLNSWKFEADVLKRWRLWRNTLPDIAPVKITSLLPLDLDCVIVGFDDGFVRRTTFMELLSEGEALSSTSEPSDQALDGAIVYLQRCRNERSGEYYLIGGTDGGVVAIWALQSLKLLARWTLFATPLISVIKLVDDAVGRLKGSVLCVATGGTLAILMLDGLEVSFIVPGGPGRLEKICLGEDNLMLIYTNDMARLWDVKTQEFWRSMTRDKAEELLEQGGWFEAPAEPEGPMFCSSLMGRAERSFSSSDASSTLVLDIRHISSQAKLAPSVPAPANPPVEPTKVTPAATAKQMDLLRPLVSSLLTFGMEESIDTSIRDAFEISASSNFCGMCSFGGTSSLVNERSPLGVWGVSSDYTSWRLLAISTILRTSLGNQEFDHDVNTALIYYAASLSETVGKGYKPPSLNILAQYWFDSSAEIRTSARALFDAAVGQLSDEEVLAVATEYQHRLPCLQPDVHKEASWAVVALIIVGNLAIARHATFSPGTITDVAASIALYLHDESAAHRVVAIDLSSRGLQIWQGYTDTMEILRSLFDLATAPKKDTDGPPVRNARAQARIAVLQIASANTQLFMTKLLLDIVQPRTPDHSRAIMQLLALLIRKKPLVLYPSLSRLMEAVVKSMDPNSSFRDGILDSATEILGEVVKLYPTVDFHSGTQKLVVGTHEGAAILYDLKTATRLYVLEGHKKRLAACSFSPDGRRLVTLSLEESVVMVWKVGSSFTSFFYPGAPPRQGHSGSEPFKTLSFNVGSEAYMTTAATLEWVGFDWPTERTARLRIRDSVLTFNT